MSRFLADLAERAVATYVQTFLGLLIVAGVTGLDPLKTAAVASIPAALSVVKSALASRYGDPASASLSSRVSPAYEPKHDVEG